jgi:hypothetical protein
MREFKLKKIINVALFMCISFSGCEKNVEEDLEDKTEDCTEVETYYTENVAPILESNCTGCHSGPTPRAGLSLDSYSVVFIAINSGDVLDRVNRNSSGDDLLMPQYGQKLSQPDLDILQTFFEMECDE